MLRRWITSRSWLVVWELLALFWLVVAANRYSRMDGLVAAGAGTTQMGQELLLDVLVAGCFAAVCAVVGLIPAAWLALGASRAGSPHPAADLAMRSA